MDYTDPQYWPTLIDLSGRIDTLDYYQILNLPQGSNSGMIKKSYYQLARALHPDKFFTVPDETVKLAVHRIYKRVTESYTILKDDVKRRKYDEHIAGPDRHKYLRFSEEVEVKVKQEQRDAGKIAKTPQGEKAYGAAVIDIQKENWDGAFRHIQTALLFESGNDKLKQLLEEIKQKRGK